VADYSGIQPLGSLGDWHVWAFGGILLAVALLVLRSRRTCPICSFGLVWVAAFLLPMSNIIPFFAYMAERFLYLPMAGFALAAASLIWRLERRRVGLMLLCAMVILTACGVRTALRVKVWRDDRALFTATVRDTPPSAVRPRRNLLFDVLNAGDYKAALPLAEGLWRRGEGEKAMPKRERAEYNRYLGFILSQTGRAEDGARLLCSAIAIDPSYTAPCLDLGIMEGRRGDHQEALAWFDRALEACPGDAPAHYNRGVALRELKRTKEAKDELRKAIFYGYDEGAEAHRALAALLWEEGRIGEVVSLYGEAARRWPDDREVRQWLDAARAAVALH
jgi:tetratricopeptide (TPR) repeat protein